MPDGETMVVDSFILRNFFIGFLVFLLLRVEYTHNFVFLFEY